MNAVTMVTGLSESGYYDNRWEMLALEVWGGGEEDYGVGVDKVTERRGGEEE